MGNNKPKLKKGWDQNIPYKEHELRGKVIAHNAKSILTHYDPELVVPRSEVSELIKTKEASLIDQWKWHEWQIVKIKEALRYKSKDKEVAEREQKEKEEKERRAKRNAEPKHILKSETTKKTPQKRSRVPHLPKMTNEEILADAKELGFI